MPDFEVNLEGQIASAVTRSEVLTMIGTSSVKKKHYHITNAVNNTRVIAVFYRSATGVTWNAYDVNTGVKGKYFIVQDLFIPDATPQGGVVTYINLAGFPTVGAANIVYIAQDTGTGYTWNGSSYVALSGGTVFAANFAALPVSGAANTLYITTDNGNSYLWDGTAYVQTSSGEVSGFVESVTGYSVDNTDPLNPVVRAIPTGGTNAGEPVTGDIEVDSNERRIWQQTAGHLKELFFYDDQQFGLTNTNLSNGYLTSLILDDTLGIGVQSTDPNFVGVQYINDYSANFTLQSLIDLSTLKKRLWTKAGAPTTTDDVDAGYVVGSLIFDTTNSILYRCTDNTPSAAVWVRETFGGFQNYTVSTGVGVVFPASSTRWYTLDGVSANATVTNSQFVVKKALRAGVFSDPEIVTGTAQPASGSITYELYAGATPSSLSSTGVSVTIPAGSAAGIYTGSGTYTIPQGEYYAWRIVNAATGNSGQFVAGSILLTF